MATIGEFDGRLFDFIIFGATGATGRQVCKYFHGLSTTSKWAIAGRNHSKLAVLKTSLIESYGRINLPDIIIADATDERVLVDTFGTCRILLNCTGPYRSLGKDIVRACITAGTHYMDICGELQFMENCFFEFHEEAVEKKIFIIHACGFDSVPADLGCIFTMRQFQPRRCCSIESFLSIHCPDGLAGHTYTAFECAVRGAGDAKKLRKIKRQIDDKFKPPKILHTGPKLENNSSYYFERRIDKYAIPHVGADAGVVKNSQRTLSMRTNEKVWPQYSAYLAANDYYSVSTTAFYESVFNTLASFSLGRHLLLSAPEITSGGGCSAQGPTEKQMQNTSFEMHFFARGFSEHVKLDADDSEETAVRGKNRPRIPVSELSRTGDGLKTCSIFSFGSPPSSDVQPPQEPDLEITTLVCGPEPCYVATPAILITLALCLLEERPHTSEASLGRKNDYMPPGGVLTPAAAFANSPTVFQRLNRAGLVFSIVEGVVLTSHPTTGTNDLMSESDILAEKHSPPPPIHGEDRGRSSKSIGSGNLKASTSKGKLSAHPTLPPSYNGSRESGGGGTYRGGGGTGYGRGAHIDSSDDDA